MISEKLEAFADKLLDISTKNNLIAFKESSKTADIILPNAYKLFDALDTNREFVVYEPQDLAKTSKQVLPQVVDDEPFQYIDSSEAISIQNYYIDSLTPSEEQKFYLKKFKNKLPAKQILIYKKHKGREYDQQYNNDTIIDIFERAKETLQSLKKISKERIQETGNNCLFVAFGFLLWKEQSTSNFAEPQILKAPLLLIPVTITQKSSLDHLKIIFSDNDPILNPALQCKLEEDYNQTLPEYNNESLEEYLASIHDIVKKLDWQVVSDCKISIFSYHKINMYRDLENNKQQIIEHPIISVLLGVSAVNNCVGMPDNNQLSFDPLVDICTIGDADASQLEAIQMAKLGKSFVLQGPPGTGKSQTIANIIADSLNDGKTILFVSEKLAALNVVYHKLQQKNLADFCLELHSHKANKKDILDDFNKTLSLPKTQVVQDDSYILNKRKDIMAKLNSYEYELHKNRDKIGCCLYDLFEKIASLAKSPEIAYVIPHLENKGQDYLDDVYSLLDNYAHDPLSKTYQTNPWYGFVHDGSSYQEQLEVKNNLQAVKKIFEVLVLTKQQIANFQINCCSVMELRQFSDCVKLVGQDLLIIKNFQTINQIYSLYSTIHEFEKLSASIQQKKTTILANCKEEIFTIDAQHWQTKLITKYSSFLKRLFSSDYKNFEAQIISYQLHPSKLSYEQLLEIIQLLASYQNLLQKFAHLEQQFRPLFGRTYKGYATNWSQISAVLLLFVQIYKNPPTLEFLRQLLASGMSDEQIKQFVAVFTDIFSAANTNLLRAVTGYFDTKICDLLNVDCQQADTKIKGILGSISNLVVWNNYRTTILDKLDDYQLHEFITEAFEAGLKIEDLPKTYKKLFYRQWEDLIFLESPILMSFNSTAHNSMVTKFKELDKQFIANNNVKLRNKLLARMPDQYGVSIDSELNYLKAECNKKRSHSTIRMVLSNISNLLQSIKPCFLMSPLSVSTYIDPKAIKFDIVIFDEASQVFPQDAIGAIFRGRQLIVVGDSKQMPPSNFFSTSREMDDDDEDDEASDIYGFESILDLCASKLPVNNLLWHYRSRNEALIAFSNFNFYQNSLTSFPSRTPNAPGLGVHFHYVDEGIFNRDKRNNKAEASYIVKLIFDHIQRYPQKSLGVVAFSISQQILIEDLLDRERRNNRQYDFFFSDDVAEPFFIKNLETVQGDERDSIIFSIAYGRDENNRFIQNFGPLNRQGGERRLNVAITRAKDDIQVVSSIHSQDINVSDKCPLGVKLLRDYLDYAENGVGSLTKSMPTHTLDHFDSPFEEDVCYFLRSNGYHVDTQVGCSGFRIDLGLRSADNADYVLAIECDGATYHSSKNARDRDRLRQQILEDKGWTFYRIWSTDWFRHTAQAKECLITAVEEALKNNVVVTSTPVPQIDASQYAPVTNTFTSYQSPSSGMPMDSLPHYQEADLSKWQATYHPDCFMNMLIDILKVEAPLSEDFLLKRLKFIDNGSAKQLRKTFNSLLQECSHNHIGRKGGFLYYGDCNDLQLRLPNGDSNDRKISEISPEELAAGLLYYVKGKQTINKRELYQLVAKNCGANRLGSSIEEALNSALKLLLLEQSVVVTSDSTGEVVNYKAQA